MIHGFALEPKLVANWGKRSEFRFVSDKFGIGTARVFVEFPAFTEWKNAVYSAAAELDLNDKDWKRLEEVFRMFGEHRCRRAKAVYKDPLSWLENAEVEHARRPFRAIAATANPRGHAAVVLGDDLGHPKAPRWECASGCAPARSSGELVAALEEMLRNCSELHLIDPHFGPENARHRNVLRELLDVVAQNDAPARVIRIHCSKKSELSFFENSAARFASRAPHGMVLEFVRWEEKSGGEKLHNRYVLTDLGGVSLGIGIEEGDPGQTDDLHILTREQYELRWSQYVGSPGAFSCVDRPAPVIGTRR